MIFARLVKSENCHANMHFANDIHIQKVLTLSPPQATIVDNVHSAPVSTEVDIYCMLVKFTTYCILMGCGKLCTVVYFQKINWRRKS